MTGRRRTVKRGIVVLIRYPDKKYPDSPAAMDRRPPSYFLSLLLVPLLLISFASSAAAQPYQEYPLDTGTVLPGEILPVGPSPLTRFDFEGPVFIEPGKMIKDHSFIKVGDLYHIFYITDLEKSFGHAVSMDLRHWDILDRVMTVPPGVNRIWAPCVVPFEEYPGYYLIYYTSVNNYIAQTTNLAFSTLDLSVWTPADSGIFEPYHPDTSWAAWDETSWSNCRDPWFFTDDNDSATQSCPGGDRVPVDSGNLGGPDCACEEGHSERDFAVRSHLSRDIYRLEHGLIRIRLNACCPNTRPVDVEMREV